MDLTVKDAARLLHTSERTLQRWIRDGSLPSYRLNDKHRLNRVELLEWATARNMRLSPEIFDPVEAPPHGRLLADALAQGGLIDDLEAADKPSALRAICAALPLDEPAQRDDLLGILLAREALGSTAIGHGVAIPHPRSPLILGAKSAKVMLARLRTPIDFAALDGKPVDKLFTIISPTIRIHLQLLSHLMHVLQDLRFSRALEQRAILPTLIDIVAEIEQALQRPVPGAAR